MDRAEFQQLAEDRVLDAEALLAAGRWSAAYHLAGYAVECGLKSCVLAYLKQHPEVVFQVKRFSERCWTHNIDELVLLAGLKTDRDAAAVNAVFAQNWLTVTYWDEASRYQQIPQSEAEAIFQAVTTPTNGILPWIRTRW